MIITGPEFDSKKMRKTELDTLCRYLIPKIEAFFDDPQNQAEFEAWRKTRREASGAA